MDIVLKQSTYMAYISSGDVPNFAVSCCCVVSMDIRTVTSEQLIEFVVAVGVRQDHHGQFLHVKAVVHILSISLHVCFHHACIQMHDAVFITVFFMTFSYTVDKTSCKFIYKKAWHVARNSIGIKWWTF